MHTASMSTLKTSSKTVMQRKSIIDLAEDSGLFSINPSDLVCETTANGHSYYDYVLSCSAAGPSKDFGSCLYLAKFDNKVNLEAFESVRVPGNLFDEGLPAYDLALMTLGILTWRAQIAKSRVLCLVRNIEGDCTAALEALKRATARFRCLHHVQATNRRDSTSSTSSCGSSRGARSEAMRMRILLCQSKLVLEEIPTQAIRETKALLNPASNLFVCLCFNFPTWLAISQNPFENPPTGQQ